MKCICIKVLLWIFFFNLLGLSSLHASNLSEAKGDSIQSFQKFQFRAGVNMGWDYPYAFGAEFSMLHNEIIDYNFGFGIGLSGAKFGFGIRTFPLRDRDLSPMFGAYFYHANGLKKVNVNVNEDQAVYEITPDNAILVNTGIRYKYSNMLSVIAGIGYSFPFLGDKAKYKSGVKSAEIENFADAFGVGGLSLNVGLLITLNKGKSIPGETFDY